MHREQIAGHSFENWSPEEVYEAFRNNEVVIIDVRTPQEFAFERIEGALLAPLATFDPENLPNQDGKRIVLHCGSGARSRKAAEKCLAAGMDPIAHLDGGFTAWKATGLPYSASDPSTGGMGRVGDG